MSKIGLITASDVEAEQKRTKVQADADNAAIMACSGIDAGTKTQWASFYNELSAWCGRTIYNLPWPWAWFDSTGSVVDGNVGDTMIAYERQLTAWEQRLAPKCPGLGPGFESHDTPTDTGTVSLVKWGAILVASLAGAYVVSQVVPPIARLLPDKRPKANPLPGRRGPHRGKRALIAKATHARFDMVDGRRISCRGTMMHDPSGRYWPKNSCLIGSFRKGPERVSDDAFWGAPRDYLGRGYRARYGSVNLPPRSIRSWTFVGYVSRGEPEDGEIQYVRRGIRARGAFYHPFNRRSLFSITHGNGRVRLYRFGSFYRLELPRRSIIDDRGFVWP